jgi:hypothetical protein
VLHSGNEESHGDCLLQPTKFRPNLAVLFHGPRGWPGRLGPEREAQGVSAPRACACLVGVRCHLICVDGNATIGQPPSPQPVRQAVFSARPGRSSTPSPHMEINASLFYLGGGTVRNFTGKVGVLKKRTKNLGRNLPSFISRYRSSVVVKVFASSYTDLLTHN